MGTGPLGPWVSSDFGAPSLLGPFKVLVGLLDVGLQVPLTGGAAQVCGIFAWDLALRADYVGLEISRRKQSLKDSKNSPPCTLISRPPDLKGFGGFGPFPRTHVCPGPAYHPWRERAQT